MFPITKKNFVFDKWVFFPVLILLIVGIFAVFSASTRIDEKYDLLFKKHFIFCLISLVMIYFFSQLSMKNLILLSIGIFTVSFFLMCLTIFFFFFFILKVLLDGLNYLIFLCNHQKL